jgi:hypothetical protein
MVIVAIRAGVTPPGPAAAAIRAAPAAPDVTYARTSECRLGSVNLLSCHDVKAVWMVQRTGPPSSNS